jgi:xylulokinase
MTILAIDLGSSGVKVAVVDREGRVLGWASAPLPTTFTPDGGAEQDAAGWWREIGACARRATDGRGSDVEAVAVTSQYMSIVAIDERGLPLMNTVMWMDGRGTRELRASADVDVELWLDHHGLVPLGPCDQAHIAHIRAARPDVYERAAAFVEPVDHLTARLTGRITSTQNTAFPLMTVDNRSHGATAHDEELVDRLRLDPAKLAPLVPFDEIVGTVTPEAADHLGISRSAVVTSGTIDSITSAIGCGVLDASACGVIIGTTTVIVTHIDCKDADLDHGLISVPSPLPGRWFVMAENGLGGKALEAFVTNVAYGDDALSLGARPDDAFERAEAAASSVGPGAGGALYQPWLVGSMAPIGDRNVRGGFLNLDLATTRAHLARAVYEGVACNAAWLLPHVETMAGADWARVRFGGGGASSSLWAQILADAFGKGVDQLAGSRTTNARGAALLALVQLGHLALDDIPAMLEVAGRFEPQHDYKELVERFIDAHATTRPFYARVNGRSSDG